MEQVFQHDEDAGRWDAFRQGDERAYASIYQEFAPVLFKYGMKVAADRELVKDAIQDLFVYFWEARQRLGPTDSIRYYLFRALRRTIVGKLNTRGRELDADGLPECVQSYESHWIEQQTQEHRQMRLTHGIENLPQRQKEAVFLRFYSDLDFNEIAVLMGINRRAVYKLIYKAIDSLQKNMLIGMGGLVLLAALANWLRTCGWLC